MIDWARVAVAVVTCCRPELCRATVAAAHDTLPDYRALYVIGNHPNDLLDVAGPMVMTEEPRRRWQFIATGRPPEHHGCLAGSWNLAMLWAFRDPEVEWLWCLQDDMEILFGWPELVKKRDADLYLAPAGDMAFLFNRRVLREVGWFDERFRVIGYHEWDWEARALLALGEDRVVIEDRHGWQHNAIGLWDLWRPARPAGLALKNELHLDQNRRWLVRKWGINHPLDLWGLAMAGRRPQHAEVEWYPWFDRGAAVKL